MEFHPKIYKPSPNSDSPGQTSHPEPLMNRLKYKCKFGLLRSRRGDPPEVYNLFDNSEFLDWATGLSLSPSFSSAYDAVLDEPSPSSNDIYVVSRAIRGASLGEFAHWSVYTQGHFFHLSAVTRNALPSGVASGSRMAGIGERITLKHDDYSTGDAMIPQDIRPTLLMAHQVGQSDYTPSEILDVANQIINDMASYSLFQRNCQHFMTTLILSTLMRKGDDSVFVGTAGQVARWDLGSKRSGDHCNTVERGYAFKAPHSRTSSLKDKFKAFADAEVLRKFIVSLQGPNGTLNINPAVSSPDEYWRHELIAPLEQMSATFKQQMVHVGQDFREGRWKDAIFGRKVYYEVEDEE